MSLPLPQPVTITFTTATSDIHFQQILELQRQNLSLNLTPQEQAAQGFVFAQHSLELLQQMASLEPQCIALYKGQVVGYNLSMAPTLEEALPSLQPMFKQVSKTIYQGKPLTNYSYIVGGQVCIDTHFRGQGLSASLYNQMKELLKGRYQLCVTEIATRNARSLKAHQRIGFQVADTYHDGVEEWHIVVWDFRM